ncbi:hypothetical protein ACQP25_16930 [Microtetraspora malaysiensis]|uniref:hypothetical protein n=1 Tax=Microtetraspora malaysiensis TaxID=161358 RepID=UPI003D8D6669
MPEGILRWEDPAPRTRTKNENDRIADELRSNPGKWAVIAENPNTAEGRRVSARLYNAVKQGYRGFRRVDGGTYEGTTRSGTDDDNSRVIRVHARFVPNSR